MVISKEELSVYKELYDNGSKCVEEDSKFDPKDRPYESHYKARDYLLELKGLLDKELLRLEALGNEYVVDIRSYKSMLAFVCRDLGRIYCYVEEPGEGEKLLKQCVELIEEHKDTGEGIIPYMCAINERSIVLASRHEFKCAADLLIKAEQCYKDFKAKGSVALNIKDIHNPLSAQEEPAGPQELENVYTLCCFYLAQMYGHLGNAADSAKYCHLTLHRQLEYKSYDPIDFALNTATLSQYYIDEERFKVARHHLAAATRIITTYKQNMLKRTMTIAQCTDTTETYRHRYADLARCWAKYGLILLQSSKDRLMRDDEDDNEKVDELTNKTKKLNLIDESYRFSELDLADIEKTVTCDYCLTFEDAKPVFHFVINWLDKAVEYYEPKTEATEYSKIMQDYADVYEVIAFFEEDPENQAKMHKRRVKYLEDVIELLNPTYYLKICRESWYKAATAHSNIFDIRLDQLNEKSSPLANEVKKANQSCMKAITHFQSFVNSYMTGPDKNEWSPNIDEDEQTILLYAHFHIGRLYYKIITGNMAQQLEYNSKCQKYYEIFNKECTARPKAAASLAGEISVVREMLLLLPAKIKSIQTRLMT